MNTILGFWLRITDPETVLFSRLVIVYALLMSLNNPISIIIQALGRVKEYHIPVEIFTLLCVPATYALFKLGYPAYSTYIVLIIATILAHIVRLICLKKYYKPFSYHNYIKSFVLPAFTTTFFASFFVYLLHISIINDLIRLPSVILLSIISVTSFTIFIGLSKEEKDYLKKIIPNLKS
jgi:O-antigen/teichoic acid export membrane protein